MGKLAIGVIGINGLYEWGSGWDSKTSSLWDDFWLGEELDKNEWVVVTHSESFHGKQFYLVGCGVSVYLHPMSTNFTFETSNSAESEKLETDIKAIAKYLDAMKKYFSKKGYEVSWSISWSVLKAEYEGFHNVKYVPDFDNERFRLSHIDFENKE